MSIHTLAFENKDTQEFRKPREYQCAGIICALLFLMLFCVNHSYEHFVSSTPDTHPVREVARQCNPACNPILSKVQDMMFTVMGVLSLCLGSPSFLRFDLTRGAYEFRVGWFPLQWTRRGMTAEIESIYAVCTSRIHGHYQVKIRWKRWAWRRRPPTGLTDGGFLAATEEKIQAYAQALGVPRSPTITARQESFGR